MGYENKSFILQVIFMRKYQGAMHYYMDTPTPLISPFVCSNIIIFLC